MFCVFSASSSRFYDQNFLLSFPPSLFFSFFRFFSQISWIESNLSPLCLLGTKMLDKNGSSKDIHIFCPWNFFVYWIQRQIWGNLSFLLIEPRGCFSMFLSSLLNPHRILSSREWSNQLMKSLVQLLSLHIRCVRIITDENDANDMRLLR